MTAVGFALLVIGVLLVVAETHVPSGALGVIGGIALIIGGITAIVSVGGPVALAVPVGVGLGLAAGTWSIVVVHQVTAGTRRRIRAGTEAMHGHVGEVRSWQDGRGQVFVDGALWRARREPSQDDPEALRQGDQVVVEQVNGLTLGVRRAEEWEYNR
jgi:membrane-bound serine protease (ClpP class)